MSYCCFEQSKETLACVSRNRCSRHGLCWMCFFCAGDVSAGFFLGGEGRIKEFGSSGVMLFLTHTKCLLLGLCKSKLKDDVPFGPSVSASSVAPVPPQVCAYAKQGGHRVLRTAVTLMGQGALVCSGTLSCHVEPCCR